MDSNISLIVKAEEVVSADRSPAGLQKRILGEEALTASLKHCDVAGRKTAFRSTTTINRNGNDKKNSNNTSTTSPQKKVAAMDDREGTCGSSEGEKNAEQMGDVSKAMEGGDASESAKMKGMKRKKSAKSGTVSRRWGVNRFQGADRRLS